MGKVYNRAVGLFSNLFGKKTKGGTTYLTEAEMDGITDHFDRYLGTAENVFHELISDAVHIDVHIIPQVKGHAYKVLFTTGMSALPMPGKGPNESFAELFMILPEDWPLDDMDDEKNYWPIRMLKQMARIPTDYAAPVFDGLSMPNGDPAEDFPGTRFQGVVLTKPDLLGSDFSRARLNGKVINFFLVMPITQSEMEWKIQQQSATALTDRFSAMGIDPWRYSVVDPRRESLI